MFELSLRGLIAVAMALPLACGSPPAPRPVSDTEGDIALGEAYAEDPAVGRQALERSIVNPDNGYSQRRLRRYTPEDWGALPIWNPRVRPVRVSDLGELIPEAVPSWERLEQVEWSRPALLALGRRAFFGLPVQVSPYLRHGLESSEAADSYGLPTYADGGVGGLVWAELPREVDVAFTCATCHADPGADAEPVPGRNNAALNVGGMLDGFYGVFSPAGGWGPGRLDVTPDREDNPTAITDLRPLRFQTHLHRAATLKNDILALAVRLETLIISSLGNAARPERQVAFALALYLYSLGDSLPVAEDGPERAEFDAHCAGCHGGPGLAGPPVPLDRVGTDPTVALSPARTTGSWRVPSLRGVGDRSPLLATGAVLDVRALMDPERQAEGHSFGLELDAAARERLVGFLEGL